MGLIGDGGPSLCSPEARADELTARFTAAGFTPRRHDAGDHFAVLTEVPKALNAESWRELYQLLGTADRWQLDKRQNCLTACAFINRTPAAKTVDREYGHQPQGADQHVRSHPSRRLTGQTPPFGHRGGSLMPTRQQQEQPGGLGAAAPYLSLACSIGTHDTCDEAEPPPVPSDLPLIYERCVCQCHQRSTGRPEQNRLEEAVEEVTEGEGC
ncbi:hypothetical protein [Streptomyces colonosanans]|uniref:hypothetical protein n=1 Tax=Streptomyces colonosanans TaxID=1428652 RepID=UPI001FE4E1CB|nr:hypothetical protein [Streptomyces colonosanans]